MRLMVRSSPPDLQSWKNWNAAYKNSSKESTAKSSNILLKVPVTIPILAKLRRLYSVKADYASGYLRMIYSLCLLLLDFESLGLTCCINTGMT